VTSEERLDGRVALVTGAGRGIGRAHALALARRGAAVVVNDLGTALDGTGRDAAVATTVVAEIEAGGGRAVADTTDVASVDGGRRAVGTALEHFGRIDIVVNNAGFAAGGGTVAALDPAGIEALLAVHLLAALGTMNAAFPDMRSRGWGRVVNTVSEVALDARFAEPLGYGVAKGALWAATLAAAAEGAPHGITVNAISPGARTRMNAELLDTGFREHGPQGAGRGLDLDPAHVAEVVAFLASDAAGDITGRVIHAAGGQLREYTTTRTARSDVVERIRSALADAADLGPAREAERAEHETDHVRDDAVD
jgi:NAD(P)-dependent dehydrogenase (short-subunit alcohol dehydrogenase family)